MKSLTTTCKNPAARWIWASIGLTCAAITTSVVLAPGPGAAPDVGLAWLLFVGASVHVAATAWLFTHARVRRHAWSSRGRYVWAPVGLIVLGIVLSVMASPLLMTWTVLILLAWQLHHFQKQNLGQLALTAASLGLASMRRGERRAICTTGAAGIGEVCAHPALLQLHLRPPFAAGLAVLATALVVAGIGGGALALSGRRRCDRPLPFCVMYGLALLFPLPIFVFTSPYAAVAGLTMAHGLQYLLLMGLVAAGNGRRKRIGGVAALGAIAVLGGAALSLMSHLHGDGHALRLFFGVYLALLAVHFVVDAGIWRLREPFVRAFLSGRVGYLVRPGQPTAASVSVADRSATDIRWRNGSSVAAASNPD
jgi:hypothetical protein